jgi:hypothetical protein
MLSVMVGVSRLRPSSMRKPRRSIHRALVYLDLEILANALEFLPYATAYTKMALSFRSQLLFPVRE